MRKGVNTQVIHHLFPSMPQFYGYVVSKDVEQFCKKWDIKYNKMTYFSAWYQMLNNLHVVGDKMGN
jgi:fatty acid desaturase